MSNQPKISKCTFVIIKLKISNEEWFIMRRDSRWKDLNFIGGHEGPQDRGNRKKTAKRELLEEIPALRKIKSYQLEPLTAEIEHGPIFSRSARCQVKYLLQFYLLKFKDHPYILLESLRGRTLNIMINQRELISKRKHRISRLVEVLDDALTNGFNSIPYSWNEDLEKTALSNGLLSCNQMEIHID